MFDSFLELKKIHDDYKNWIKMIIHNVTLYYSY